MKKNLMAMTKADKMVIKSLSCVIMASAALAMCSCSKDDAPQAAQLRPGIYVNEPDTSTFVTISFAQFEITPMGVRTRSTDLASSGMTHIDMWVISGTDTTQVHQTSSDTGFGSASLSLNKTKTYSLIAIAHKAADRCTLTEGIIEFPGNTPKESFFYSTTFSPATTTAIVCEMKRITGKFTLATTDAVPDNVDHFRFIVSQTGTRFAVATSSPTNIIDRTVDFASISRKSDNTTSFAFQVLSTADASSHFDITATAYDSDNNIIESKTFADVPIRNGYRTQYTGAFFVTSPFTMTFTTNDWQDFDTVNF